jgi:sec-independent protein translocase protein TatA
MGIPGGMEWILIALVVLLLFGGKKIPELAKGLGTGIKNFKKAVKEEDKNSQDDSIDNDLKEIEKNKATTAANASATVAE